MGKDAESPSHLPAHSTDVDDKKILTAITLPWTRPLFLSIPGVTSRRLRIHVPNYARFQSRLLRRRRSPLFIGLVCFAVIFVVAFARRSRDWKRNWHNTVIGEPSTLVFHRKDLQKIWKWEVDSGHYPSRAPVPVKLGFVESLLNPGIPPRSSRANKGKAGPHPTDTFGIGAERVYLDIQSRPPDVAYPPRPVPGSVADLDEVMRHCDFSKNKYVRDCLEVLRIGGGLDNGQRYRRENLDDWRYIYLEQPLRRGVDTAANTRLNTGGIAFPDRVPHLPPGAKKVDPDDGLVKKKAAEWERQIILSAPPRQHRPASSLPEPCDEENPRVFHMFWTGPFTDKPYVALLSFLYTQNTGLHLKEWPSNAKVCRPQFFMWINPGPAASVPNPNAVQDMYTQLKTNPWAAPFLHPRFKDVIHFKVWNTTEQLDGIPEIKDEWRALQDNLFNSGGHVISVKKKNASLNETAEDDLLNRAGSKSSSSYDRLSVILSDMARFVLCHRFGGIYLDADTIFLRDWEELWGWKGAFAYRWSRLAKYNTAVLRMNKNSALGTFLFRTALKNGLDFHPMTVSRYTADAQLEGLLLRLPDALFDAAWLNTEDYQRDRPPQPFFTEFRHLFETPLQNSASPQALGFNGFFRGSYSYHFHNFWWKPFDPARNWPELGPRFQATEQLARNEAVKLPNISVAAVASSSSRDQKSALVHVEDIPPYFVTPGRDKRDLDWSSVLKRTFESYIRGEIPNMYGEWLVW